MDRRSRTPVTSTLLPSSSPDISPPSDALKSPRQSRERGTALPGIRGVRYQPSASRRMERPGAWAGVASTASLLGRGLLAVPLLLVGVVHAGLPDEQVVAQVVYLALRLRFDYVVLLHGVF